MFAGKGGASDAPVSPHRGRGSERRRRETFRDLCAISVKVLVMNVSGDYC